MMLMFFNDLLCLLITFFNVTFIILDIKCKNNIFQKNILIRTCTYISLVYIPTHTHTHARTHTHTILLK